MRIHQERAPLVALVPVELARHDPLSIRPLHLLDAGNSRRLLPGDKGLIRGVAEYGLPGLSRRIEILGHLQHQPLAIGLKRAYQLRRPLAGKRLVCGSRPVPSATPR